MVVFLFMAGCSENQPVDGTDHPVKVASEPVSSPSIVDSAPAKDSVSPTVDKPIPGKKSSVSVNNKSADIKIFRNDSALYGFGYDIYVDGKIYVHQPNIPAVQGNRGFTSEQKARRTAELVVYKILNNILPPSVDTRELDSLGVVK